MIIALTGLPSAGKDEFAKAITKTYKNAVTYAFADPIKKMCCAAFDWDMSVFDFENKDKIDDFWKIKPREALEFVGSIAMREKIRDYLPMFDKYIGEKIWVKRFEKFYYRHKHSDIIITDLRYDPEYEFLDSIENKKIIRIERSGYPCDTTKSYDIYKHPYDILLHNDIEGSLLLYHTKCNELYTTIKEHNNGNHSIQHSNMQ